MTQSKKHERRLRELRVECERQHEAVAEIKRESRGATPVKRKQVAKTLTEAQAELALIEDEIGEIERTLPEVVEAEGREAGKRWIASIAQEAPPLVEAVEAAQKKERALTDALAEAIEAVGAPRKKLLLGALEVRLLRARWPELKQPPVVEVPPLRDAVQPILKAQQRIPAAPKRFDAAHTASADAEERRRNTWKAVTEYLARHGKSLSEETRGIFERCPPPDWETPTQKTAREEREREAAAEEARFADCSAGEAACAQPRRGL